MNITINDEKVDFTLAQERRALDIYAGIEKWLCDQQLFVSDLGINGEQIFLDEIKEWGQIPVEKIDSFDFIVLNRNDLSLKHYNVVISFFSVFIDALKEGNSPVIVELLKELPAVTENLPAIIGIETGRQMVSYIVDAIKESGLPESMAPEKMKKLIDDFGSPVRILEGRVREIQQPEDELKNTGEILISLLLEMEELSVNLQTGKDAEAMNFIIRVVELLQKVIRLIFFIKTPDKKENGVLSGFAERITGILSQVEEAFISEDSVLIGDLMEYELKPVLEEFPQILSKI